MEDVLRGAALMSGTGVRIIVPDYTNEMPVRANGPLTAAWVRSQRERGRDPLPAGVLPETVAAGTDFGNVSQRVYLQSILCCRALQSKERLEILLVAR